MLKEPRSSGDKNATGLAKRDSLEWHVVRGNEEDAALLIAARKSTCPALTMLEYQAHDDHSYREKKKDKMARTRMMACTVEFRQNIGHIGREINVLGVHGHHRTMKMEWPTVFNQFWDRLAWWIGGYQINFFAGDFNMALTQVINRLAERGITCDCCAWYPWRHATTLTHDQSLGFDSQAIFYVGGTVKVRLVWGFGRIHELTAVAEHLRHSKLHEYTGQNTPGQHWACYRHTHHNEADDEKDLTERLQGLLQRTTSQADLDAIQKDQEAIIAHI